MQEENRMDNLEDLNNAPKEVREGVEGSLNLLRFIGDVADLYIGKSGLVFMGMIDGFHTQNDSNSSTK